MECGVPFCHHGCPLGNLIPDWNDLVYRDRWREAIDQLHRTNNFPEFTGRLCPAPCEAACVLEINEGDAVSIKQVELAIINRAWDEGWITPRPPATKTGRRVAVIGSGPAGLACAQQLTRTGEAVTVFERDEAAGGLVRFSVPEFKIEKWLVERRIEQLVAEGVEFAFGVDAGVDVSGSELRERFDAVVVATGARVPRDLPVPGRELDGVHFAMDYLYDRARVVSGSAGGAISAAGRPVIVIGGGDTGADCVGHAHREGAASVTQIELLGEPPRSRPDELTPWPLWPMKLRTSYALAEGGDRDFSISTTHLTGSDGRVDRIHGSATAARRRSTSSRARRSPNPPGSSCLRWASSARSRSCSTNSASPAMRAATPRLRLTPPRPTGSSPPATPVAASRSWSGRFARAGTALPPCGRGWTADGSRGLVTVPLLFR